MNQKEGFDYVKCLLCNLILKRITNSHLRKHSLTPEDYKLKFPLAEISSLKSKKKYSLWRMGRKLSEETKQKISLKHKGKTISQEMRLRISEKQKGKPKSPEGLRKLIEYYKTHSSPMKGKKHSEETKRKLSIIGKGRSPPNKGKPVPEQVKEKISKKLKGKPLSLETRQKMRIARQNISLETRLKISRALKGKPKPKRTIEHTCKILESSSKHPNKFETECINLFNENNLPLKFVGDFKDPQLYIAGKVPDFVSINGRRLLVEVYTDYYKVKAYGSIENYKTQRADLFSKYGWKTLFFSDKDIKLKPQECVDKIKKELI